MSGNTVTSHANDTDVKIDIGYQGLSDEIAAGVQHFCIEDNERNTKENPHKEATSTMPRLVRRIDSREILPRPLGSTNQLICLSYLSLLCCCCFGAFATHKAIKAKLLRNKGIYASAQKRAKHACWLIIAAAICGGAIWLILAATVFIPMAMGYEW